MRVAANAARRILLLSNAGAIDCVAAVALRQQLRVHNAGAGYGATQSVSLPFECSAIAAAHIGSPPVRCTPLAAALLACTTGGGATGCTCLELTPLVVVAGGTGAVHRSGRGRWRQHLHPP